jgi:hypothetical protein
MIVEALVLAAVQTQPLAHDWVCGRNFEVGGSRGIVSQAIAPDDTVSAVALQVWDGSQRSPRLYWDRIPAGEPLNVPNNLTFSIEIPPQTEALWVHFYGDGRYVGRDLIAKRDMVRSSRARGVRMWIVSLSRPAILAALMAAGRVEFEIVTDTGEPLLRDSLSLAPGSAIRSAYEVERRWLESVTRTRAEPCVQSDPDSTEAI